MHSSLYYVCFLLSGCYVYAQMHRQMYAQHYNFMPSVTARIALAYITRANTYYTHPRSMLLAGARASHVASAHRLPSTSEANVHASTLNSSMRAWLSSRSHVNDSLVYMLYNMLLWWYVMRDYDEAYDEGAAVAAQFSFSVSAPLALTRSRDRALIHSALTAAACAIHEEIEYVACPRARMLFPMRTWWRCLLACGTAAVRWGWRIKYTQRCGAQV